MAREYNPTGVMDMNMWATSVRADGKKYDPNSYSLVITVFGSNDDPVKKVMDRLRGGTVMSYATMEKAAAAQAEFMEMASIVAKGGELAVYCMSVIVDMRDGKCYNPETA
jgi:hypothetical protein